MEIIKNPYPGIRSFEIEEHELFFGREKQINELLTILQETHFIAITGASGSGKSSLVKAGLIPLVVSKSKEWSYLIFRPGNRPITNLSEAITNMLKESGFDRKQISSPKNLEHILFENHNSLPNYFEEIGFKGKLLLYIDQFEEIFRFTQNEFKTDSEVIAIKFVDILIALANQRKTSIYVVFTLRTDFLSDCTNFPGLPEMINNGHYLIPKMTFEEKERAIKGPAKIGRAEIEENLLIQIKEHIKDNKVSLPVLQHALMRTWEYRLLNDDHKSPVKVEHYKAIGTVTDALSVHAEMIYDFFDDEGKQIIEKIFKTLTHLGDDNRGVRRPTLLSEICEVTNTREIDAIEIIDKFRAEENSFLLPNNKVKLNLNSVIDISHESIMRVWKRLVIWVDEETKSAQTYLRLSKSAELYQEGKTGLLVNPDLQLALKWQEDNNPNETWAKRYDPAFDRVINYIEYSKKEYEKNIAAKEEKQKRNLKRARLIALFLGSASVISILFLILSLNLKFKAENSEKIALEKEKLAKSESKIAEVKKKEAVSQKLIAKQQQEIAEEHRLLAEEQKQYAVVQQKEAVKQKSFALIAKKDAEKSRDKAHLLKIEAEKLRDKAIEQKQIAEQQKNRAETSEAKTDTLSRVAIARALAIQAIKLHISNQKLSKINEEQKQLPIILALQAYYFNKKYKGNPNDPDIFNALSLVSNSQKIIRGRTGHKDAVRAIAIANDEEKIVSASDDGEVRIFHIKNSKSEKLKTDPNNKDGIRSLTVINNNKIVAGTYNGNILLWTKKIESPIIIKAHKSSINQIINLKNSNKFITVSSDGTSKVWNNDNIAENSKIIFNANEEITAAAISINGNFIAYALKSGQIKVIHSSNYSQIKNIQTKGGKILSLVWNNYNDINIGYQSGKIEIRRKGKIYKEIFAHTSGVTDMIYNAKTRQLISCSFDSKIKVWDINNIDIEPIVNSEHDSWIYKIALLKNKQILISGSSDKSIRLTQINMTNLKNITRKKVTENMSLKNWKRYVGEGIEYNAELPNN